MKFKIDDHPAGMKKASFVDVDFSKLETELKDYAIKQEVCACVCVCLSVSCRKKQKHSLYPFWLCCLYLTSLTGSFCFRADQDCASLNF